MRWEPKSFRKYKWRQWFAWRPVYIPAGIGSPGALYVWFEIIERRFKDGEWTYRFSEKVS